MSGAICLTFDDVHVEQWAQATDLLGPLGYIATHFVSGFQNMTDNQIGLLRKIQDAGGEVGLHSATHPDLRVLESYLNAEQYIRMEVTPPLTMMRARGLSVSSWAYPFNHAPAAFPEAMRQYFVAQRVRSETTAGALHDPGEDMIRAYGGDLIVRNDRRSDRCLEDFIGLLDAAERTNQCAAFYMHNIADQGSLAIPFQDLRALVEAAVARNMRFLTASGLTRGDWR